MTTTVPGPAASTLQDIGVEPVTHHRNPLSLGSRTAQPRERELGIGQRHHAPKTRASSAGAIDVDLAGAGTDFAIGCGYKYLCGGPGGPAYLYVNPVHQDRAWPTISGWMGHAKWDRFLTEYEPDPGVARHLTGTPPVVANEIFTVAAEIWREVRREDMARKHESLTETLIAVLEQECGALGVEIDSPKDYERRGGHVSFRHAGAGPASEALVDHGLLCSFRYPNAIRLGVSPVCHRHEDVWRAVQIIKDVLAREAWRDPKYERVSI